jgi:hypothetical protein
MKQLSEMADKLVPQVLHKIYNTVATEMAYSDIDLEGDEYNEAHSHIMLLVINKLTTCGSVMEQINK